MMACVAIQLYFYRPAAYRTQAPRNDRTTFLPFVHLDVLICRSPPCNLLGHDTSHDSRGAQSIEWPAELAFDPLVTPSRMFSDFHSKLVLQNGARGVYTTGRRSESKD